MPAIGAFICGCAGPALSQGEIEFLARTRPWGLILFRRNCETPEQLLALTTSFREAVGRKDAPVLIDQEGGRVQRLGPPLSAWRAYPAARVFGQVYARDPVTALRAARNVGRLMAADLRAAGITVNCVPVLDLPQPDAHEVIGSRAYGVTAEQVLALARAHAAGFLDGGVLPVIKHIPGHGRARSDSHLALPVVDASRQDLAAHDFVPFVGFADAPMAMTAHVVYTAIDRDLPGTLSPKVIKRVIRKQIGFDGLLMTDDLSMKALAGSFADRARGARAAGCDVVLHCNGEMAEMEEVAAAAGPLTGKSLRRARTALKIARKPQRFDMKVALADLERLVSG